MGPPNTQSTADGHGSSQAMLALVDPSIYRRSAFRLTGLTVDASARDIRRRSEELTALSRLGGARPDPPGALLPLRPAPDAETVQTAIDELRSPDRRLIQELFWFWPAESGDRAWTLLAAGEVDAAAEAWRAAAVDGQTPAGAAAVHNLAVLCHARVLDWEQDGRSEEQTAPLWTDALRYWRDVVDNDVCWYRLAARVRQLADPRLTVQIVDELRAALPAALCSASAALAARAFADGDIHRGLALLDHIDESEFPDAVIERAYDVAAEPSVTQIRRLCRQVALTTRTNPDGSAAAITALLDDTAAPLAVLDLLFQPGHLVRDGLHDEVALAALAVAVAGYGESIDAEDATPLMERAGAVAATEAVRVRMRENLDILEHDLQLTTCWFCGDRADDQEQACEVPMHGNVQHQPTWNGTKITWQSVTALVPRCEACSQASENLRRSIRMHLWFAVAAAIVGVLAALVTPLGIYALIAAVVVGGAVLIRRHRLTGEVSLELDRITEYSPVADKLRQGWRVGGQPPGTT